MYGSRTERCNIASLSQMSDEWKSPYYWRAEQKKQEEYVKSLNIDLTKELDQEQRSALAKLAYINKEKEISLGNRRRSSDEEKADSDGCLLL